MRITIDKRTSLYLTSGSSANRKNRTGGESEDWHQGSSSQSSRDSDNLSDNLCILIVSQPLRSLIVRRTPM
jgi:hypothetical protein